MLLNNAGDNISDANIAHYGKTEVCLVLSNKFEVPEGDDYNLSSLFIKTKELLVAVIPYLKSDDLDEALKCTTSSADEALFRSNIQLLAPIAQKW